MITDTYIIIEHKLSENPIQINNNNTLTTSLTTKQHQPFYPLTSIKLTKITPINPHPTDHLS